MLSPSSFGQIDPSAIPTERVYDLGTGKKTLKVQLVYTIYAAELSNDIVEKAKNNGKAKKWKITNRVGDKVTVEKEKPRGVQTFYLNGKEYETGKHGIAVLKNVKAGKYEIKYQDLNGNPKTKVIRIQELKNEEEVKINEKIDFVEFLDRMEMDPKKNENNTSSNDQDVSIATHTFDYSKGHDGEHIEYFEHWHTNYSHTHKRAWYENNSWVTCNRFNNDDGDQYWYDKVTDPGSAWDNFYSSDCDMATDDGAPCPMFSGNGDDRYCMSWNYYSDHRDSAKCSMWVGHEPLYHAHTYENGPSGY